jgi:MFS family permease
MGLECEPGFKIGLMGSMYFLGMTLTGIFVTRLGDIYGRLTPVRVSSLLSIPICYVILQSESLNLSIFMYLLLGFCYPGKCQVDFVLA